MPDIFQLSKSNRATCRKCKEKIPKDVVRFGEESVFVKDGNEIRSFRWYHFHCALEKFKERVANVEEGVELLDDTQKASIEKLRSKTTSSDFGLKSIADLTGEEGIVNVKGTVLRVMKPREHENIEGKMETGRVVYIEDDDGWRGKTVVFSDFEIEKGSPFILLRGVSRLGSDEKVEVIEGPKSEIRFSEKDINHSVQKYISEAWDRPRNIFCEFEVAPSARAACTICEERIKKGELKLVKAVWGENEKTKDLYPRRNSYHLKCALKDEDAEEFIYEATTRLSPQLLESSRDVISDFLKDLKEFKKAHSLLVNLLY